MSETALTASLAPSVGSFSPEEWNALGGDRNPFVSHQFLTSLEDSGSVGQGTGWQPAPLVIAGSDDALLAALPSYAKGHSQGEYVFDHSWAHALERAGGQYYPKLQICAPFTPANGPRLLFKDVAYAP
ncbi:MAG TPA: GNAT family N-acetyltransferase, partial [Erythrobacter sp.]|nr:GNAT family N-acetyltransferase [Erythrobacter sp.]